MATSPEFAAYVQAQLGGEAQGVRCRKMFGEYGLHHEDTFFGVICDGTLYLKPTPAAEALLAERGGVQKAPPYDGAREYLVVEAVDDEAFLQQLLAATLSQLPAPKPKMPKAPKAARAIPRPKRRG